MEKFFVKVEELKKKRKKFKLIDDIFSGWLISKQFSPYFSVYFIEKKIIPNEITLKMIYSGIIGAILFLIPNLYLKILGAFFIHLWFILDYSDGEVARETKKFSRFGKELDYMAHIINHPLFSTALCISLIQREKYNIVYLILICSLSTVLDLIMRNLLAFKIIVDLKDKKEENQNIAKKNTIKNIIIVLLGIFIVYPNIPLIGVFLYFIDIFYSKNLLIIYITLNVLLTGAIVVRGIIQQTKIFKNTN